MSAGLVFSLVCLIGALYALYVIRRTRSILRARYIEEAQWVARTRKPFPHPPAYHRPVRTAPEDPCAH